MAGGRGNRRSGRRVAPVAPVIVDVAKVKVPKKLVRCDSCDMWQYFDKCNLVGVTWEIARLEDFTYKCSRCMELEELKNELSLRMSSSVETSSASSSQPASGVESVCVESSQIEETDRTIDSVDSECVDVVTVSDSTVSDAVNETTAVNVVASGPSAGDQTVTSGSSEEASVENSVSSGPVEESVKPLKGLLILGDSMVRGLNPFKDNAEVACKVVALGGAGVERLQTACEEVCEKEQFDRVVIEVGTNDVGRRMGSEVLLTKYRELIHSCLRMSAKPVVMGILPRFDKGRYTNVKILSINMRLAKLCMELGVPFLDPYSHFIDRPQLFRDRLHLNGRGLTVLERLCQDSVCSLN